MQTTRYGGGRRCVQCPERERGSAGRRRRRSFASRWEGSSRQEVGDTQIPHGGRSRQRVYALKIEDALRATPRRGAQGDIREGAESEPARDVQIVRHGRR